MSICQNQDNFNKAIYDALKYNRETESKKMVTPLTIYMFIHLFFLVWGLILAFSSQPPVNRVSHITLAIISGPIYVLSHYLKLI